MTPSGTLNLRNNTYNLEWGDLSNICIKVWFPLCTNSISLGVLQEFEAYLAVIKSLKRSLLLALPGECIKYPESDSNCHGNKYLPFFSPLSSAKTALVFLLPVQVKTSDKSVHISAGPSNTCLYLCYLTTVILRLLTSTVKYLTSKQIMQNLILQSNRVML